MLLLGACCNSGSQAHRVGLPLLSGGPAGAQTVARALVTCGLHKAQGMGFSFRKQCLKYIQRLLSPKLASGLCSSCPARADHELSLSGFYSESITSGVTLHRCPFLTVNDSRRPVPFLFIHGEM